MIEFYGVSGSFMLRDNFSLSKIKEIIDSTSEIKKETGGAGSKSTADEGNEASQEDVEDIVAKALTGTQYSKFLHKNMRKSK